MLARHRGDPGAPRLRAIVRAVSGDDPPEGPRRRGSGRHRRASNLALTRSEAEERFLHLLRSGQVEGPETNVLVARHEVDFLWRNQRLIAEIDGFSFHSSRLAFERDRRRDATLTAAGFRVTRVTWRQLVEEPEAVLVRLARALATAAG